MRLMRGLLILLLPAVICLVFFLAHPAVADWEEPDIKDIVVCNVYWEDYRAVNLPNPLVSKFVVTFDSAADPGLIESITIKGPSGYTYDMNIAPYNHRTLNGYIGSGRSIWFMGFDRNGFLKNGRYDITLKYKSGRVSQKGRVLDYSDDLLNAYLKIKPEFSPTGNLSDDANLRNITLKWTVVPGIEANYMTRIGTNRNDQKYWGKIFGWVFQDSIFGYGTGNPNNTGLNKSELKVGTRLRPGKWYLWFTEILDSNDFNQINIAIFLKYQYFVTAENP